MMAEDWDLFAVVRSCQSATNTATTQNPLTITNTIPSSIPTSIVKEEEYDAFSFPNIVQPITNELQELNHLFTSANTTTTTTTSGCGINPNSPDFDFAAGCFGQQERQQATTPTSIWPHFVPQPPQAPTSNINRFHDQQLQQQQNQLQVVQKQEFQVPQSNSAIVLPNAQPQTPRSRKRKSQQGKMVCHVTADNLSADLWAWRKYGQKPIKGSPYPRNYYRCSSSKGCTARKQVEQSNTEAHMFIVTYTGDHTHPRPTHRNSLAGSTRNKSPAMHPPTSLSFQPNNTTTSSSSAPNSPVTSSAVPPDNDLAHDRSGPDPDPEMQPDEE